MIFMIDIERILILSPHTDDAELGAGATINKFINQGKEIYWVVFSTAEESLPSNMPKTTLKDEFLEVANSLSLQKSDLLINNFKVRKLHEHRQEILEILVKIRNTFHPNLVIGPSLNDFHQDHIVVANEMVRAFKNQASIISYELPWNHMTFNTQMFIRLSEDDIKNKIKLIQHYKSQIIKKRKYFQDDFIYGMASMRGIQTESKYAEAFEVIRWFI
jgi:N-acetylglucosamine malate deacetylase 1